MKKFALFMVIGLMFLLVACNNGGSDDKSHLTQNQIIMNQIKQLR